MDAFIKLNAINCNDHTEKKNGLTYLSWAWAWAEVKKLYPASFYTVYENRDGLCYHTDGKTCWVKTGVTIVDGDESLEHVEFLPIMDNRNKSIPLNAVTSMDINKAIQRSLTKACARHGLGLYIYAGEDLPEDDKPPQETPQEAQEKPQQAKSMKLLLTAAVDAYGKEAAPKKFDQLLMAAGCTRETMTEAKYDTIYNWIMDDLNEKKGA